MKFTKLLSKDFDLHIVDFSISKFNKYKNWRINLPQKRKKKEWNKKLGYDNFFFHELSNNLKIKLYKDSELSRLIYNGFEEDEIDFVNRILTNGDIFIDIGSNIGLYSIFASSKVGSNGFIYAFEPTPKTFERLNENILLNSIINIETLPFGLSDKDEILKFNIFNNEHDELNSFAKIYNSNNVTYIPIQVKSLDAFIKEKKIEPSKIKLIKIDVEGWETPIIKGAQNLLSTNKSPTLLVEFSDTNALSAGYSCKSLFHFVESFGYKWYSYNRIKKELVLESLRDNYPYCNLIATKIPEEIDRLLK